MRNTLIALAFGITVLTAIMAFFGTVLQSSFNIWFFVCGAICALFTLLSIKLMGI